MADLVDLASTLMQSRQTILPKRLLEPGPNEFQLAQILNAAASAPDHGQITPWRFILVPADKRELLAEQFVISLMERDPQALASQIETARQKAFRSPLLLLAVVDENCGDPEIDIYERMVSLGCAIQNMLLMATAQGFGSALTSGKALKSQGLRHLFALEKQDTAICFISVGTVLSRKTPRLLPAMDRYSQRLAGAHAVERFVSLSKDGAN